MLRPLAVGMLMLMTTASFVSAQTSLATYICAEHKSVGWEKAADGSDSYGKFEPGKERFLIQLFDGDDDIRGGNAFYALPKVRTVSGDKVKEYTFRGCDPFFQQFFTKGRITSEGHIKSVIRKCQENRGSILFDYFGTSRDLYQFEENIMGTPNKLSYMRSSISSSDNARLTAGACVRTN